MVRYYPPVGYVLFFLGWGLQTIGYMAIKEQTLGTKPPDSAEAYFLVGTLMCLVSITGFAIARGRSWLWGLLGLIGIFGLIIVTTLREKPCGQPDE